MEVHHHPNLHHNQKKWKEYFLEFLMLFLAVTLGFFAESYREHLVEVNREKEFISTFVEDLKSDTASINKVIIFRKEKMLMMDSLLDLLGNQKIKGNEGALYYYGRTLIRTKLFLSNDRTLIQLRNSGALRLIKNEAAADSMIAYQKLVELLKSNHEDERTERSNVFPVLTRMFDPFVFDKMISEDGVHRPGFNPPLRSYDRDIQLDLAAYVNNIKGSTFLIETRLELLKQKAVNAIEFLKSEYALE
jgi:hypothetical protein